MTIPPGHEPPAPSPQPPAAPKQPGRSICRLVVGGGLVAALAVGLGLLHAAAAARTPGWGVPFLTGATFPGGGRLFARGLALAGAASVGALLLAFPVGVCLGRRGGLGLAGLSLVPLVIPPHLAAYVWRLTWYDAAQAVGLRWATAGLPGAAWTLAAMYWPICALPVAVAVRAYGRRLEEELATLATPRVVFWRAIVPGLAPALVGGAAVVFILSLANYGVPLMWDVPAQVLAVYARLEAFQSLAEALWTSVPIHLTALALILGGLIWLSRRPYGIEAPADPPGTPGRRVSRFRDPAGFLTGLVLTVTVAVPVASLVGLPGALRPTWADWRPGWEAFRWGLVFAALGATGATAFGLGLACLAEVPRRPRVRRLIAVLVETVGLMVLLVPALLVCLAAARLMVRSSWLVAFYRSLAVFVLAYGVRYAYLAWKVVRVSRRLEGRRHGEMARLLGLGAVWRARLALAGTLGPALAVSWLVVFVLAFGELDIAKFLCQPGRQPMSVFFDNQMHYARQAGVAQWALIVIAALAAIAWGVLLLGAWQWRRWRATA